MRETAREQYRRMAVESATPAGLVGMLYEGVVTCLRLAMEAAQRNDIPRRVEHGNRALDIIAYLARSLRRCGSSTRSPLPGSLKPG
jgi:flagellar biosynthetic protein FliS